MVTVNIYNINAKLAKRGDKNHQIRLQTYFIIDHDVVITLNTCHLDITCMIEQTKINKTNSGDFSVVK